MHVADHRRTAAIAAVIALAACTAPAEAPSRPVRSAPASPAMAAPDISAPALKLHLDELQRITTAGGGSRATGRQAAADAIEWLRNRLIAAGYRTTVQDVPTPRGTAQNLLAETPGGNPERVLIVGGHLDS